MKFTFKWPAGCSEHQQSAGFGPRSSRPWSFPHCNPASSLLLGGRGLSVRNWVMWLGLGKPGSFWPFPTICLLTNPACPLSVCCILYIYCRLSQNWRGAGERCGAWLLPLCPLLGSSSGVVHSQRQAAADICQKGSNRGLAHQRCWAVPDLALPHGMLRMPEPWSWLAVRVGDVLTWLDEGAHGSIWVPGHRAAAAPRLWQAELLCLQFDLYWCSGAAALRPGKVKLGNCGQAAMQDQEHINLSAGQSGDVQGKEEVSSFFAMKP